MGQATSQEMVFMYGAGGYEELGADDRVIMMWIKDDGQSMVQGMDLRSSSRKVHEGNCAWLTNVMR